MVLFNKELTPNTLPTDECEEAYLGPKSWKWKTLFVLVVVVARGRNHIR